MERPLIVFYFRCGDWVCWPTPQGPCYQVQARLYVDGPWRTGYTARPPHGVPEEPHAMYLLRCPTNVLSDVWATDAHMHRATPEQRAALESWALYQAMPTPPWEEVWQAVKARWGALKARVLRRA